MSVNVKVRILLLVLLLSTAVAGAMTAPGNAALFLLLCTTQEMTDNVARISGLPSASPPSVVVVEADRAMGWVTTMRGRFRMRRGEWYRHNYRDGSGTVYIVRGNEAMCPHGITHRLQTLAGLTPWSWESEKQAVGVQREYWRIHHPAEHRGVP